MPTFEAIPIWFIIISVLISIYQGIRGFTFQYYQAKSYELSKNWKSPGIIFMFCLTDCFFYFITTLIGFLFLFIAYFLVYNTNHIESISGGTSAVIIFLVLFGILGICGQLPYLIQSGKLPGQK